MIDKIEDIIADNIIVGAVNTEKAAREIWSLLGVSDQRELLFDFVAHIQEQNKLIDEVNMDDIDSFLSNNSR